MQNSLGVPFFAAFEVVVDTPSGYRLDRAERLVEFYKSTVDEILAQDPDLERVSFSRALALTHGGYVGLCTPEVLALGPYHAEQSALVWYADDEWWVEDTLRGLAANGMSGRRTLFAGLDGDLFRQQWDASGALQIQQLDLGSGIVENGHRNGVLYHFADAARWLRLAEDRGKPEGDVPRRRVVLDLLDLFRSKHLDPAVLPRDLALAPGQVVIEEAWAASGEREAEIDVQCLGGHSLLRYSLAFDREGGLEALEGVTLFPNSGEVASRWSAVRTAALEFRYDNAPVERDSSKELICLEDGEEVDLPPPGGLFGRRAANEMLVEFVARERATRRGNSASPGESAGVPLIDDGGLLTVDLSGGRSEGVLVPPGDGRGEAELRLVVSGAGGSAAVLGVQSDCACVVPGASRGELEDGGVLVPITYEVSAQTAPITLSVTWSSNGRVLERSLRLHVSRVQCRAFLQDSPVVAALPRPDAPRALVRLALGLEGVSANDTLGLRFGGDFLGAVDLSAELESERDSMAISVSVGVVEDRFGALRGWVELVADGEVVDFIDVVGVRQPPATQVVETGAFHFGQARGHGASISTPVLQGRVLGFVDGREVEWLERVESQRGWSLRLAEEASHYPADTAQRATIETEWGLLSVESLH